MAMMDWTMMGGFVALAALVVGLFRDVKGDVRAVRVDLGRRFDDSREALAQTNKRIDDFRAENREAHAQTNKRIDDLRAENREAHAQTGKRIDDLRSDMGERFDDLRAENREAHAQTGKRIDDFRATVVAVVPRAAADTVPRG